MTTRRERKKHAQRPKEAPKETRFYRECPQESRASPKRYNRSTVDIHTISSAAKKNQKPCWGFKKRGMGNKKRREGRLDVARRCALGCGVGRCVRALEEGTLLTFWGYGTPTRAVRLGETRVGNGGGYDAEDRPYALPKRWSALSDKKKRRCTCAWVSGQKRERGISCFSLSKTVFWQFICPAIGSDVDGLQLVRRFWQVFLKPDSFFERL